MNLSTSPSKRQKVENEAEKGASLLDLPNDVISEVINRCDEDSKNNFFLLSKAASSLCKLHFKDIKHLTITIDNKGTSSGFLSAYILCDSLQSVDIASASFDVSDDVVEQLLSKSPDLRSLSLRSCRSDMLLDINGWCKVLEEIHILSEDVTAESVWVFLSQAASLKRLSLPNVSIVSPAFVSCLPTDRRFTAEYLSSRSSGKIDRNGVSRLMESFPKLKAFDLFIGLGSDLSQVVFVHPRLENICLSSAVATCIPYFNCRALKSLDFVSFGSTLYADSKHIVVLLRSAPHLQKLDLGYSGIVTCENVGLFLPVHFTLREVTLYPLSHGTNSGVLPANSLDPLSPQCTPGTPGAVSSAPEYISPDMLRVFAHTLPSLTSVHVEGVLKGGFCDRHVVCFLVHCPCLRRLTLVGKAEDQHVGEHHFSRHGGPLLTPLSTWKQGLPPPSLAGTNVQDDDCLPECECGAHVKRSTQQHSLEELAFWRTGVTDDIFITLYTLGVGTRLKRLWIQDCPKLTAVGPAHLICNAAVTRKSLAISASHFLRSLEKKPSPSSVGSKNGAALSSQVFPNDGARIFDRAFFPSPEESGEMLSLCVASCVNIDVKVIYHAVILIPSFKLGMLQLTGLELSRRQVEILLQRFKASLSRLVVSQSKQFKSAPVAASVETLFPHISFVLSDDPVDDTKFFEQMSEAD